MPNHTFIVRYLMCEHIMRLQSLWTYLFKYHNDRTSTYHKSLAEYHTSPQCVNATVQLGNVAMDNFNKSIVITLKYAEFFQNNFTHEDRMNEKDQVVIITPENNGEIIDFFYKELGLNNQTNQSVDVVFDFQFENMRELDLRMMSVYYMWNGYYGNPNYLKMKEILQQLIRTFENIRERYPVNQFPKLETLIRMSKNSGFDNPNIITVDIRILLPEYGEIPSSCIEIRSFTLTTASELDRWISIANTNICLQTDIPFAALLDFSSFISQD